MTWAGIAPCSAYNEERVRAGLALLEDAEIHVTLLDGLHQPHFYLAAPDPVRLAHLQEALSSDDYEGAWVVRGGAGMTRILDQLDWSSVDPSRLLVGFSDVTPLLNAMATRGMRPIHGPVLHSLHGTAIAAREHLYALLRGQTPPAMHGTRWVAGDIEGPLVGGNATLVATTCGTAYQVQGEGAIIVLEDIGEPAYRLDRVLSQLISAGIFEGAAGIALGQFSSCRAGEGWSIESVLKERLIPLGIPLIADLPIGHVPDNRAFAVGGRATLSADSLQLHGLPRGPR